MNKGSRNRTHAYDFEDHCSTIKLYPLLTQYYEILNLRDFYPLWLHFPDTKIVSYINSETTREFTLVKLYSGSTYKS